MKRFAIQVTAFFVWTGMNVQEPKFPFNNAEDSRGSSLTSDTRREGRNDEKAQVKALKGLKMIYLEPGETKTVEIELPAS